MNTAVHFSRAKDEWATPPDLFAALDAEFAFYADAAARPENTKCATWFGPGGLVSDALAFEWADLLPAGTCVFLNPPYSRNRHFMAKAAAAARHGLVVVALVPARTDTRWWHAHVWDRGDADSFPLLSSDTRQGWRPGVSVRFVKGRLRFGGAKNTAPFPSAIVIFESVR